MGPRIKPKVDDRWEPDVYRVMSKKTELPVYGVQKENGEGPLRILHRNLLLPIGVLESPPEEPDEQDELQPRTRRKNQPTVLAEAAGEEDADPEWAEPIDIKVTVAPGAQMPAMQPAVMEVEERADEVQEESSGGRDEDTDGDDGDIPDTDLSSAPEEEVEPPALRRSQRVRRPVDRLNLMQQVTNFPQVDRDVSGVAGITSQFYAGLSQVAMGVTVLSGFLSHLMKRQPDTPGEVVCI